MRKTAAFWISAALAVAISMPAAAQEPSTEHVRSLIAQAMQQAPQAPTPAGQAQTEGPVVPLTADDAVKRALERNLDLQVQRLAPQLQDLTISALWANYRPQLTGTFLTQGATTLPQSQLQGGGATLTKDDTLTWNSGVLQSLPWGGGNFSVRFNNTRSETTNPTAQRNPGYNSNIFTTFTQPLLRNFKTDTNRSSLLIARLGQQIEDITLRGTVTNTEASVRNAYWDLVFAIENLEATRRSFDLATKLVQDNRARVEIGTMAPIDVVQAQAEEATRRQAVVTAEATVRTSELALKRLIVGGTDDELWRATITPVDRPSPVAETIDLEAAVRTALSNRTDVAIARRNLEQNDVALKNLRNLALPALDFVTNYNLQGRGGTDIRRDGFGGPIIQTIPGGYSDALRTISRFDAPTWSFALNLTYPIGYSAAEVGVARARIQVQQTQAQIKQAELQVATDVTTAAVNVRNTLEAVQASATARELSEKRLEAAQSKFEVGMATNFEVVQAQRDLADARTTELRNLLNYRKALVDFQRSQLTGTSRTVTSIR